MKLTELEPQFLRIEPDGHYPYVSTLAEAQGIEFLCPKCFREHDGPAGTHIVVVWFRDRGVPSDELPLPGRWGVSGSGFEDLSITPSISLENSTKVGCQWHGFVTNGEAT